MKRIPQTGVVLEATNTLPLFWLHLPVIVVK
jgi:hypothetical protein